MNNKKHVSLKDLAEELGVSVSTVSRALKDSPEVGEEMRIASVYVCIFLVKIRFLSGFCKCFPD